MAKKRVVAKKKFCFGALISFVLGIFALLTLVSVSFGIANLVLGIISIIFGIVGLIMMDKLNRYGKGWAIAGIVLSVVALVLRYMLVTVY
jgi:hypothetical protein